GDLFGLDCMFNDSNLDSMEACDDGAGGGPPSDLGLGPVPAPPDLPGTAVEVEGDGLAPVTRVVLCVTFFSRSLYLSNCSNIFSSGFWTTALSSCSAMIGSTEVRPL